MIERNVVSELLKVQKTPFYIFEQQEFINNYRHLEQAFREIYPNYQIAYSYKTNYTPFICKCVKELGGFAEVVSDMEYTLAKKLGYSNDKIIYNGPCKGELLEEHLLNGGISNIDSAEEANRVIAIAKENPDHLIKVGLRINSDIGANYISRFGLELDSDDLSEVVSCLQKQVNIRIAGIHCHISRARGLAAWERRIENMLYAADEYCTGIPEYIDVGSGMYGVMEASLAAQFGDDIPTYEAYAAVVAGAMETHYRKEKEKPVLFSEPGTTIIAKYLNLVTCVKQKKTIKGKCFATVDSSYFNAGEACTMKRLPYYVLKDEEIQKSQCPTDIMGYTCLEQDCIYHDFEDAIEIGDIIVFGNVGGYSIVYKPPFIQPNCPIYNYEGDNKYFVIKRQEIFEDIFTTFLL